MYTHSCVKCGTPYQDSDPDAYYCTPCNDARLKVAREIDAHRPKGPSVKVPSALEQFDAQEKFKGFVIDR